MLSRLSSAILGRPASVAASTSAFLSRPMSTTITAAVATGVGEPMTLETLTLSEPRADEVAIRIVAVGICHTDIACRDQHIPTPTPIVLGHEGVGIVESVGDAVTRVAPGDKVLMSYASCGGCVNCQTGVPSYCSNHRLVNFSGARMDGSLTHTSASGKPVYGSYFRQSAFATHALATQGNVVKVPDHITAPLHSLAPLGCGVQTGAGAVMNTLRMPAGSSFAVFGAGTVGLSGVMAARAVGATTIVAVDTMASRLEVAKDLGATHTVLSDPAGDPEEVPARIAEVVAGQGGLDFSLDTTGRPEVLKTAIQALRPTGIAALVGGSPPGSELSVDMLSILLGRGVRGVIQGDSVSASFLPKLMDLHQQGRFPFDRMIKYYDSLNDINQAIEDSLDGSVIKPVLMVGEE